MTWPSRDSRVWWFGMISSGIVALAANRDLLFPWIPDTYAHALSLAAFLIGVVSGKMASSPRPSKAEQKEAAATDDVLKTMGVTK